MGFTEERVVFRFLDGRLLKGYLEEFHPQQDRMVLRETSGALRQARLSELKAVFFVKSFEGQRQHRESKSFRARGRRGRKVFIRFKDGESLTGYTLGDIPWRHGFFLGGSAEPGFFMYPTDQDSNNIKIYVVASAVEDVTRVG
jgi:hypothetical protein